MIVSPKYGMASHFDHIILNYQEIDGNICIVLVEGNAITYNMLIFHAET